MSYLSHGFSPTREYEVHMLDEEGNEITQLVTLPENINNSPLSVSIWYNKYIPVGCLLVDIVPFEQASEHVGFGDSLDYVGPDQEDIDDGERSFELDGDDSPKEEA
jgi:hypothetical protein